MSVVRPSDAFARFVQEINDFEVYRDNLTGPDFNAKQRMIARVEGFAIREAYLDSFWRFLLPGRMGPYFEGVKESERRLTEARETKEGDTQRHRAEICLNLYARTIQQFTQRRLYTVAAVASVAAAIASVASLTIMIVNFVCGRA